MNFRLSVQIFTKSSQRQIIPCIYAAAVSLSTDLACRPCFVKIVTTADFSDLVVEANNMKRLLVFFDELMRCLVSNSTS